MMFEVSIQDIAKFLINPLFPAFLFILIHLLKKTRGNGIIWGLFLYLYAASIPFPSKYIAHSWAVADSFVNDKVYDAVIVLAGVSDYEWYVHRNDSGPALKCYYRLNENADRILTAIELVHNGRAKKILLGDVRINGFSEGDLISDFLLRQGLSPEQFAIYGEVINTLEEAKKLKDYLGENNLKALLLITSANHMRRAKALFKQQGLAPDLLSVNRTGTGIEANDFIPGVKGLKYTGNMLYEIVGYAGYWLLNKTV